MSNKNNTVDISNLSICKENTRRWYIYILIDIIIYAIGLIILLIYKLIHNIIIKHKPITLIPQNSEENINDTTLKKRKKNNKTCGNIFCGIIRNGLNQLISTQYFIGRNIILISTIGAFISLILYLIEMLPLHVELERCNPLKNPIFIIDLACNIFFLIHFLIRLFGSNEKLSLWLNIYTITDVFTIPQIITSIFINREWTGLRFLRVISINRLQTVLQTYELIKSATVNRAIQLLTSFITAWILGAGFFHLLENSGNFIANRTHSDIYHDINYISFGDSLYFVVVTFSTVGYGDISPKTIFGKIFVTLFILFALAIIASLIPELAEFLLSRNQYRGIYKKERGRLHVVVCGNINYTSGSTFLSDFYHEDRSDKGIEVVFLNQETPSSEMKGLLKAYFTRVRYYQGTVLDQADLDRVQMYTSSACLVLANQASRDPNSEDSANIMRAISLKNYNPTIPVVVQLLQFENRCYLEKVPNWDPNIGDHIICYSEIELGMLAQSCMVPGFSTLLTNIYSVRSDKDHELFDIQSEWLLNYLRGVSMEIYSAKLSKSFEGMSYRELAEFCFKNLNLLLIAIELIDSHNNKLILINPLNLKRVSYGTIGYFICDTYNDARNAKYYCTKCHAGIRDLSKLKKCNCGKISMKSDHETGINSTSVSMFMLNALSSEEEDDNNGNNNIDIIKESMENLEEIHTVQSKIIGDFYGCENQKLSRCVISDESQTEELNNHIIMCLFSDDSSQSIGMKSFLMPLRTTTFTLNEIKLVLIIADKSLIENEWHDICMFPKIKVVYLSSSIKKIINLIRIDRCSRCVVLNSNSDYNPQETDLYMVDKDVIIANLYFQAESKKKIKALKNKKAENEHLKVIKKVDSDNDFINYNIINNIPIMSKLSIESNVQFLDADNEDKALPNYLRKPFAFGLVFTGNNLDSLMSTAYFSPSSMKIMEMLISGGCFGNDDESFYSKSINRFRIMLIEVYKLNKSLKWDGNKNIFYRELFLEALQNYSYLALGLYRKIELSSNKKNQKSNDNRYVFTNPPASLLIDKTDMVYCILNENVAKPPDFIEEDSRMVFPPICQVETI